MKRREFVTRASLAAALTGLGLKAGWAAQARSARDMKIALFSSMFKAMPLNTAIQQAAAVGYDGIEIAAGFGTDHLDVKCTAQRAREIKTVARDNNLAIVLIYTGLGSNVLQGEKERNLGLEDVKRFLSICDEMSCKMLKVTAGRLRDSAFREDEARTVAAWLSRTCQLAARHDVRVATEIHFGQYCETTAMARRLIDLVNRPNFGVIHDAGNMHITGDSYGAESVKRLGDRIFHVHVKDMVKAAADDKTAYNYPAGRFKRAPLNQGNVDHKSLFQTLRQIGYQGYLSCEASGGDDPLAVAKHELAEVEKLLRP